MSKHEANPATGVTPELAAELSAVTEREKCRGGGPHGAHHTAVYKPGGPRGGLWALVSAFDC